MVQETSVGLLIRAGAVYDEASADPVAAREAALLLLEEGRRSGPAEGLVEALRALAQCHRVVRNHAAAEPLLDEAARLAGRHGLDLALGRVLATRGALRHEQGRTRPAVRDLARASVLLGGAAGAEVDLQRAAMAHNAGRLAEASALYSGLLRRRGLPADLRTRAANNLGLVEARLGRHASAATRLEQAAVSAAEVGGAYVAQVAESRAWAAVQAGRLGEGVARFDAAAQLWREAGLPLGELHADYADALEGLRLLPEATEQARTAVAVLEQQGVPLMAAEAQLRLARLALAAGDTAAAVDVADRAAARLRHQRRPDWVARARLVGVQARTAAGDPRPDDRAVARRAARTLRTSGAAAEAGEAYLAAARAALALDRPGDALTDLADASQAAPPAPVLARLPGHVARAHAARLRGDDAGVLRACRAGLADLARHRSGLPSTELRALASGHGAELAELGLAVLVRSGPPARVLGWMERTRAHALAPSDPPAPEAGPADAGHAADGPQQLDGGGADSDGGAPDVLAQDLAALRALEADLDVGPGHPGADEARRAMRERRAELEQRIRRRSWSAPAGAPGGTGAPGAAGRDGTEPRDPGVPELRRALGGRVLVEYDVLDGRLVAVVVTGSRSRLVVLGGAADVDREVEALRITLRALASSVERMAPALVAACRTLLGRLHGLVVDPLGLDPAAEVVVVPVGPLQAAPWSALLPGAVSVAPSASLWWRSVTSPRRPGRAVLVAGPDLDAAVAEVDALAAVHPGAQVLVPPRSTSRAVRAALAGAAVAHLACHGRVRSDNPLFSSLLLADGPLTLHELDRRAAVPQQVVLAACDVGAGVVYPGNELLGFVGTLLARGARGLVASTTLVADAHVLPLMQDLHTDLAAGCSAAVALHAARARLDPDDPRTFAAWCTFTAYGGG